MPWWQFALLGAVGGAIVEVLAVFRCVVTWQEARRNADSTVKRHPPPLRRYVDLPAHAIMLPARVVLGAVAALLCGVTRQVTGPYGAVAFGCSAPVLLAQLGSIPQVAKAVNSASKARQQAAAPVAAAGHGVPAEPTAPVRKGALP